jgi:uncharacterized membrane-anchored protein
VPSTLALSRGTHATDNLGVPLETSTIIFSIFTRRREAFYWLAILVTFALGTVVGDLISEGLGVGYFWTGTLCAALIASAALGWRMGLNAVLAFWIAYSLTRPLGTSPKPTTEVSALNALLAQMTNPA